MNREAPDLNVSSSNRKLGWMFVDNCPPIGASIGLVIPFDISVASGKSK